MPTFNLLSHTIDFRLKIRIALIYSKVNAEFNILIYKIDYIFKWRFINFAQVVYFGSFKGVMMAQTDIIDIHALITR